MNKPLTMDQKKAIISCNYGISQFGRFIDEDAYGDTASWKILERWISEVLEVDYRNDIYNNKIVTELNRLDSIKYPFVERYSEGWFIGDALKNRLYKLVHLNVQDEQEIRNTEAELKAMWEFFNSLLPTKKSPFEYELVGELNGEMLYRRVKNEK